MVKRVPVNILLQAPLSIAFQTACSSFVISKEWQVMFIAVGLGIKATPSNPKPRPFAVTGAITHVESCLMSPFPYLRPLDPGPRSGAGALTKLWTPFQLPLMECSNIMKMTKEPHRSHFITDEMSVGSPWVISVLTMCPDSFSGADFTHFPFTRTQSWKLMLEGGLDVLSYGASWPNVGTGSITGPNVNIKGSFKKFVHRCPDISPLECPCIHFYCHLAKWLVLMYSVPDIFRANESV